MDDENLTSRLARLSPAKRGLLERKLGLGRAAAAANVTIPRRRERDLAPLSFAQQRLWFLNQLEPESSAYNEAKALQLEGILNVDALKQALNAIVDRHEVLRTTFSLAGDGAPIQLIGKSRPVDLPIVDLGEYADSEHDTEVRRAIADLQGLPFDISRDLMLRAALFRLAADRHVLVVIQHHIASDGWSSGVFWRELAAFYDGFSQRRTPLLPELPIQYADFAAWQRKWLTGEVLESQLSYWREQLKDPPLLKLPTDRPRPAARTHRGARQNFRLSRELTQGLKNLSSQEHVTLFMTLLAAFQTLLLRYSGEDDIAVGSPIANRNRLEIEGLIGFFVNTLVLRVDLSGNPTFCDLLSRVRRIALESYAYQDLPFERLVEELQPKRDLSSSPLFQVMFALQNVPRNDFAPQGLTVTPVNHRSITAKFDLSLAIYEIGDELEGQLEYATELFDSTTIGRMAGHFQTLLEAIVADPRQRIALLPLLTENEQDQMLVKWNDTAKGYPANKCIHELFEEQAERIPDAIAVAIEDQQLSYGELNRRANQLAHYLTKLGVRRNTPVGISMDRSIDMMVGLLGILKAGSAYLPLDPNDPAKRLAFMLNDGDAGVLVTQEHLIEKKRSLTQDSDGRFGSFAPHIQAVCLDKEWNKIAQESQDNLNSGVTAEQLAYLIYTSGSTGQPKGVMVSHHSLVAHSVSAAQHYQLQRSDRVLQFASLSFDVAAEEIFPAWLSGASVLLVPHRGPTIPEFVEVLIGAQVTVANLPSAYWHHWVDELDRLEIKLPPSLRLLIVGSDRVSTDHFKRWQKLFGKRVRWLNAYGPTEATVTATLYEAPTDEENWHDLASVPIGRPMTNRQTYVLDCSLHPQPTGVAGELFIGGASLACGYLNRPELTAEKFIANPFSSEPGARLYRTGDLVRYLADGNIEFLGRADDQVKVRGYRIELAEIEALLIRHPAIHACVVVAREDSPGDKRLAAYVVAASGSRVTADELRRFLKEKLPEFMIPATFSFLSELPLTPNGKVDRKTLPAPDLYGVNHDRYIAPRTATETKIAEIWSAVLKADRIGVHDNFFEIGGHSLLAMQLISRAREAFQIELRVRQLFEAPTVSELAQAIEKLAVKPGNSAAPAIPRVQRDRYRVKLPG